MTESEKDKKKGVRQSGRQPTDAEEELARREQYQQHGFSEALPQNYDTQYPPIPSPESLPTLSRRSSIRITIANNRHKRKHSE